MKSLHINKIFGKIIKGEYLLIYIFIYIASFGIVNYVVEQEYIGRFYVDPGLVILNSNGEVSIRGNLKVINDNILTLGSIEIPKKYKKNSEFTLLYISGKTKKEILDKSKEVLNLIDMYKFNNYKKPSDLEAFKKQQFKKIHREYKIYSDRMNNALKSFRYLLSQASNAIETIEGMSKREIRKISIKCRFKEKLQTSSLCTNYKSFLYLKKLEDDLNSIGINSANLSESINSMKEAYVFKNAKYLEGPIIEVRPLIQSKIYSLAFLVSILGISLIAFFKLLKFFTTKATDYSE